MSLPARILTPPSSQVLAPLPASAAGLPRGWLPALALSQLPLVLTAWARPAGDLPHYQRFVEHWFAGQIPYRELLVEYPPYALLAFGLAGLVQGAVRFQVAFALLLVTVDTGLKVALLKEGARRASGWRAYVPFAALTVVSWVQGAIYLKRYDLLPAALTVFGVLALVRGRFALAGAHLWAGVASKLYPAVLLPWVGLVAWGRGQVRPLFGGLLLGGLPLVALSSLWPWWRFAHFHSDRGLQVESLGASVLLVLHALGHEVSWVHAVASFELKGPLAEAALPWAKTGWLLGVAVSVAVSGWVQARAPFVESERTLAITLFLILGFVTFHFVLSPQYLLWLAPFAALLLLGRFRTAAGLVLAAALLTRVIYPSALYQHAPNLPLTTLLTARNLLLVGAWILLLRQLLAERASSPDTRPQPWTSGMGTP